MTVNKDEILRQAVEDESLPPLLREFIRQQAEEIERQERRYHSYVAAVIPEIMKRDRYHAELSVLRQENTALRECLNRTMASIGALVFASENGGMDAGTIIGANRNRVKAEELLSVLDRKDTQPKEVDHE